MNTLQLLNKLGFLKPLQRKSFDMLLPYVCGKKSILEIGTAGGGSLALFSQVAAEDAELRSIDIKQKRYVWGLLELVKKPKQEFIFYEGESVEAMLGIWTIFDFIFIDGSHSYKDVKRDYEDCLKVAQPGCVIAFHDIFNKGRTKQGTKYEVWKLWNEIKDKYEYIELKDADIGIIFIKEEEKDKI
jgi:predicted O-methyltransferase YrrM